MSTPTVSAKKEMTPAEAAGYIAGTVTGAAQTVMPVRMWILISASTALVAFSFSSDSLLHIARALCAFAAVTALVIGAAIFGRRAR